ncbi:type I-C CRISPR-associated endonuclease Cas1c [Agrilactobacillus yilanensis]|uniref:CRISPR-associated endonuclease Cas1 n=1 Tax=Agrilactobacillus yilanensis TaxID=2485997 RepID=A0ABW4J4B2_9LACO|nr:type I-C CRISPR-associated endonuclease Cas1c [Agrilactobacillus yilanensis]
MKKLLNTLYITKPDTYLFLDGGNIGVSVEREVVGKVPLLNFESIVIFARSGASPALIQSCLEHNISMTFLTPNGRFCGRVTGMTNGNVILRKQQYRISDDSVQSTLIARNFIFGKIANQRSVLQRILRDHKLAIDIEEFQNVIGTLQETLTQLSSMTDLERLRGVEGNAAQLYFSLFDQMILQQKKAFIFEGRNRRPPLDNTNALLSFAYSMLAHECAAALESVGLDAYVGFMHQDRPGRLSLSLDLMEELRSVYADRFVLKLINKQLISDKDFNHSESGAVQLTEDGRKTFITQWQKRKEEKLEHPFLKEKIIWGLVPHVQALLLARYLRGDLDAYPPFLWK